MKIELLLKMLNPLEKKDILDIFDQVFHYEKKKNSKLLYTLMFPISRDLKCFFDLNAAQFVDLSSISSFYNVLQYLPKVLKVD